MEWSICNAHFLPYLKNVNIKKKPASGFDCFPPLKMHGASQLGLGPVLESADDVDIDVEADEEGDAELEDGRHHPEADPGVAAPVLLADLDILEVMFANF